MVLERYTHLQDAAVGDGARIAFGLQEQKKQKQVNPLKPKVCPRCNSRNPSTAKYCRKCWLDLDYKQATKDIDLLQLFKTKYAKYRGVDIDELLTDYKIFKSYTSTMVEFYDAFNGTKQVKVNTLKQRLDWEHNEFNHVMEALLSSDIIKVQNGDVYIQTYQDNDGKTKSIFDNFIKFQKQILGCS